MKKFLFVLVGLFVFGVAFGAGENIPTSKSFVDNAMTTKQDAIPANDGATQVLTNTGVAGEYDTRGIYDSTGEYATQAQNLVDAATMNAGVQNAINSEFQCIEYDENNGCLLFDVFGQTEHRSPNLFDVSKISTRMSSISTQIINNGDGSLTVTAAPQNSAVTTSKKLSELAPGLIAGRTYTFSFTSSACDANWSQGCTITLINDSLNPRLVVGWRNGRSITMTDDLLNATVYFQSPTKQIPTTTISNIQITEGTTATPYVPYGNLYLPMGE